MERSDEESISQNVKHYYHIFICRGGSRTAAISKMDHFVIIVSGQKPLTIITKSSILDVVAVLDPPLGQNFIIIGLKFNWQKI